MWVEYSHCNKCESLKFVSKNIVILLNQLRIIVFFKFARYHWTKFFSLSSFFKSVSVWFLSMQQHKLNLANVIRSVMLGSLFSFFLFFSLLSDLIWWFYLDLHLSNLFLLSYWRKTIALVFRTHWHVPDLISNKIVAFETWCKCRQFTIINLIGSLSIDLLKLPGIKCLIKLPLHKLKLSLLVRSGF